jgi:hypothetical protein
MANKTFNIIIQCDQIDCIHNGQYNTKLKGDVLGLCKEPEGVIISTRKGCLTKQIEYPPSKRF